jgi:hypothetical protein
MDILIHKYNDITNWYKSQNFCIQMIFCIILFIFMYGLTILITTVIVGIPYYVFSEKTNFISTYIVVTIVSTFVFSIMVWICLSCKCRQNEYIVIGSNI